ncbi:methyltransferase domain-containing protein [Sphaerisporangium sp. NPDC051011]|uniref:class I SAM-dependent methyltransferase n=1 Tax=Sphaerisporangium sp. NPDC051011 TaxID=3155792 RepID=UPI0033CD8200
MTSGPAGDFDYDTHGHGYAVGRRTDPRIAAMVHAALGDARTVVNVGAGAGSYEPEDRYVTPVEPSAVMRGQRPAHRAPAVIATAENLPFDDHTFDAAMATITVHQWADHERGLRELRRVSRGPVVILTFDGDALDEFWLAEYAPELFAAERPRYPAIGAIASLVGPVSRVEPVPVPIDCVDGFVEAYYARPECLLDPQVRASQSAWGFVDDVDEARAADRLRRDLESGAWDEKYGYLRRRPEYVGSLRLIVGYPASG